ncbi:MAG TPA: 2-oxoglutarate dehydrogenase E1 component [Candidatus Acidoferrales bacterium]|jgi:2-oxoglutarate dehydrogenase E1 component|nr:2-oxoglutarate dehydrogenase E1 component [Candidatus Acidoferrales bacterium]
MSKTANPPRAIEPSGQPADSLVFDAFRRWGYLAADLDPLGFFKPLDHPELRLTGEVADRARRIYCSTIGAEFMHIPDPARRKWIIERLEAPAPEPDRARILERLVRADLFEQVMQSRYLGSKRFSLEGTTALIPLLDEILRAAAEHGAVESVMAMSHRGRLNVMAQIACKTPRDIFAGFEDVDPRSVLGGGDVKYHVGATGTYKTPDGREIGIHLVSNPSHLEAVDPVAMGRARAKQDRLGGASRESRPAHDQVLPVVMHGDGAFAGQGILAEVLNLAGIKGYEVGGTIQIVVNNLIAFTTVPAELESSRFASDIAKRLPIPIFHVNGEDLDAVERVGRLAAEYRFAFASEVVVDLIGYRRHGHSEVDDPTITQPLLYRKIKDHPPLWQIHAQRIGTDATSLVAKIRQEYESAQTEAGQLKKIPALRQLPAYWSPYKRGRYDRSYEVDTGVAAETIAEISRVLASAPEGFHVHPKVKKLLEQRAEMGSGKRPVDFGCAELLAFGALVREGTPVRLSGQDSRRGTFNQRHSVIVDTENENEYVALENVSPGQARFEAYNSALSEAGVLGFEYGYSRDFPEALVLWEAQFGDFANGAQVIIDQFISSGEDKWNLPSGVVLLLPHGYEGQGPEHSSARIERFLQLAAEDNIQICQPSSASQYFHLLRRQALRPWRKPLVVFTPKSMLRNPDANSPLSEFSRARFLPVVPDAEVASGARVLVCSGKIGHDLRAERTRLNDKSTAILFVDQLYPFPEQELSAELTRHSGDIVWVQEEPGNMGALFYMMLRLRRLAGTGRAVRSVKRSPSASPATGSAKAHELEQKTLLTFAFTTSRP